MDGKKGNTNGSNIVLFPNLSTRLVEKGLGNLEKRDFKSAASLFRQAKELEPDHVDLNMGLLVSLVELGYYEDARELCQELLRKEVGDYLQVVNIYLMVLLQLNNHEEMIKTIEQLFDDQYIPFDKMHHFEKMLEFSKRAIEESAMDDPFMGEILDSEQEWEFLFQDKTDDEILLSMTKLSSVNIRPYIGQLQEFLVDEKANPFHKTLLIHILQEQEYDKEIKVAKFSKVMTFIPTEIPAMKESPFFIETLSLVDKELNQESPSLLEMVIGLFERQQFILYPFLPDLESCKVWAAGYHVLAEEYQTGSSFVEKIAKRYEANANSVEEILVRIKGIEESSYADF